MNKKNNRRRQETKMAFQNGLLQMLEDGTPLSGLSVKKLCEATGYNRATFYAHYSILEDVLKEAEEVEFAKWRDFASSIRKSTDYLSVVPLLDYLWKIQTRLKVLFLNRTRDFAKRVFQNIYEQFGEYRPYVKDASLIPYIDEMMVGNAVSIISKWMESGFELPKEEVALLVFRSTKSLIECMSSIQWQPLAS